MHKVYEVFGLFEDATLVDAAVADLQQHGVPEATIDVRQPEAGRYRLADELLHEEVVGFEHGAAKGAAAGAVVGVIVAAAGVSAFGIPAMVMLALFFAGMGGLVGGMAGMQQTDPHDDDPQRTRDVLAPEAARLVVVRADHQAETAHKVLERHGAIFLDETEPHRT